MDDKRA